MLWVSHKHYESYTKSNDRETLLIYKFPIFYADLENVLQNLLLLQDWKAKDVVQFEWSAQIAHI